MLCLLKDLIAKLSVYLVAYQLFLDNQIKCRHIHIHSFFFSQVCALSEKSLLHTYIDFAPYAGLSHFPNRHFVKVSSSKNYQNNRT